ncbi:MAG TPA: alpha/beta fold hydrolase [Acidimicrobiia bacterium]|nr:alpha/beta fold hydrolase [Acidimicrobiia bacterium]
MSPRSYPLLCLSSDQLAMRLRLSFAIAAVPAVALWRSYRHAIEEFSSQPAVRPRQRGRVRSIQTSWGRLTYRLVPGSAPGPALVLVHGWGRAADSVWWQFIELTRRTVLAIDLPGHGRSLLEKGQFTFDLAAEAVIDAIADAHLIRPILVGHSLGGPISLVSIREGGHHAFSGFVAIASSAFWTRPRQKLILAAAPYALSDDSPILIGFHRAEVRRDRLRADRMAWEYSLRPSRAVLTESAHALRRFDARRLKDLTLPPTLWVVTTKDGVVNPADQLASAQHFGVPSVSLKLHHSEFIKDPASLAKIIEDAADQWSRQLPIGIRRRSDLLRAWDEH